jgi:hypothetical protein
MFYIVCEENTSYILYVLQLYTANKANICFPTLNIISSLISTL